MTSTDSHYVLDRNELESDRLSRQHYYLNAVSNRDTLLPPSIDPSSLSTVLDIPAGNLVWTFDLATLPEIRTRLSPASPNPVKLYACDLSSAQFPPSDVTRELGITAFEHDVTLPFPDHLNDKFDLVHMRLLAMALTEDGWKKALENVRKVLKPGGHFIIFEANSFLWQASKPLPVADWKYHEGHLDTLDRSHWLRAFHDTYFPSIITANAFIPDLVDRLPSLLASTSWNIVSHTPYVAPVGARCKAPGLHGQSLAPFAEFTADNFAGIFDAASRHSLRNGTLRSSRGIVETEEERQQFLSGMERGLKEEGLLTAYVEIVATKN